MKAPPPASPKPASVGFPAFPLQRLARHVYAGDVVFFIGSGFSVESEQTSYSRFVRRLLARLVAFSEALAPEDNRVIAEFLSAFGLEPNKASKEFPFTAEHLRKFEDRYYETNERLCFEFGRLLFEAARARDSMAKRRRLVRVISRRENELLREEIEPALEPDAANRPAPDSEPLDSIDAKLFSLAAHADPIRQRAAGKALFLETMGFHNPRVMAGAPTALDLEAVQYSYGDRLRPKHHVLARFAREGWCTTTLTTNFDLLLEGAFRLAGFDFRQDNQRQITPGTQFMPPTTYADFARLTCPTQFFTDGKAHRTAMLVKMHGCAELFRNSLKVKNSGGNHGPSIAMQQYLPSLVFTYREIQNWRTDSWAADFLRTLLRTRVVVFCGYSVQDPVIHDTFRTVYEEMARLRKDGWPLAKRGQQPPAFFFAYDRRREFYGREVLRAAARAVGIQRDGLDELHTIDFQKRSGFPNLDETFRWLFHLVFRRREIESLQSDLRRIATLLLRRPPPEAELQFVRREFFRVFFAERRAARSANWNRWKLDAISAWTEHFHVGLLREFAAVDTLHRRQGLGPELNVLRRFPWYYPSGQDTGWTAWATVVELALRRMAEAAANSAGRRVVQSCVLRAGMAHRPTVLFPGGHGGMAPVAVTIHFPGFQHSIKTPDLSGQPRRRVFWRLANGDAPWRRDEEKDSTRSRDADPSARNTQRIPSARTIWRWATRAETDWKQLPEPFRHLYEQANHAR